MNELDRKSYRDRYERRLKEHGYSPQTLGWGQHSRQEIRFGVLAEQVLENPTCSVLDVGCGFADLHDYLSARGWRGHYTGIDIVPGLLEIARDRHPELDLREIDITEDDIDLNVYDFVIASGVFNSKLTVGDNRDHIWSALVSMARHGRRAVCVDFLSSYVDFIKPGAWHTDPCWVFDRAKQISRRVLLRHDYMPYEFALFIYLDQRISHRNTFEAFDKSPGQA